MTRAVGDSVMYLIACAAQRAQRGEYGFESNPARAACELLGVGAGELDAKLSELYLQALTPTSRAAWGAVVSCEVHELPGAALSWSVDWQERMFESERERAAFVGETEEERLQREASRDIQGGCGCSYRRKMRRIARARASLRGGGTAPASYREGSSFDPARMEFVDLESEEGLYGVGSAGAVPYAAVEVVQRLARVLLGLGREASFVLDAAGSPGAAMMGERDQTVIATTNAPLYVHMHPVAMSWDLSSRENNAVEHSMIDLMYMVYDCWRRGRSTVSCVCTPYMVEFVMVPQACRVWTFLAWALSGGEPMSDALIARVQNALLFYFAVLNRLATAELNSRDGRMGRA